MDDLKNVLKQLPSVDELIKTAEGRRLSDEYGRETVVSAARAVMERLRADIIKEDSWSGPDGLSKEEVALRLGTYLADRYAVSLRRAINATGVILHTSLGRAVLPQKAIEEIDDAIKGYCTLAIEIESGQRGRRDVHVRDLLCELTGAEDAAVVNNNAAATMLILNTLARGKEVIVSRGQLVEIGGSFRMPEVMEASGAILKEVGTTNKTHLRDYVSAVNENTGAILHVHQSNYRIVGFTEEPSLRQLVELAGRHKLPVIDDLGSGALLDLKDFGLKSEPMVRESVREGADAVCFSGDKLIGGPQSGIIVGKSGVIERIRKNPLARSLRVGKMTLAGLEATLKLFLNPEKLRKEHPLYRMLSLKLDELEERARKVAETLRAEVSGRAEVAVVDGSSEVGSGSAPAESIPTKLLSVKSPAVPAEILSKRLRYHNPPVFSRVHKDCVLLDFRTIQPDEDRLVVEALSKILNGGA